MNLMNKETFKFMLNSYADAAAFADKRERHTPLGSSK